MARVSVLMPVWKPNPRFLREAVDSVRAQTMQDWELIVVEDPPGSGVDVLLSELRDSRIRHRLRGSRGTLADALNDGLAMCAAPLVARLDADDRCRPDRLARQAAHLDSRPDVAAVGTSLTVIDNEGRIIGHRRYPTTDVAATMRRFHEGALKFEAVRDVIRSTINMKLRYFREQMSWRDRLRIMAERLLLLLPPSIVLRLFRLIEYRA